MPRLSAVMFALACLVAGCVPATSDATPGSSSAPSPAPSGSATDGAVPIVIDADLDHSDIAAILVLLRDPRVDVRAIAIDGTGLVHCQGGLLVTRYLLEQMGVPGIPFGCGRQRGGDDATPFPDEWRATADGGYGLDIAPRVETEFPPDAVTVIREAVDESAMPVTIVALGPLTNLEDAFDADPSLPARIARIHAMLGTIDAPGNVFVNGHSAIDGLEWNAFADPSAVQAVFAADVPIDLIPLDATDDVPVPTDLADRFAADHAAAGADLMYELLLRNPSRMAPDQGQQLWDELAALSVSDPGLVTWAESTVSAREDGRIVLDPGGRTIRYAAAADRPAVEGSLLTALRRGGPRLTPFELGGTIAVTWTGTACTTTVEGDRPGVYTLSFSGPAGPPSGVYIAGVQAPRTWPDLVDFITTVDVSSGATPPGWIVQGGQAVDEQGTGSLVGATAQLAVGIYGPVCVTGVWPDLVFTPGEPFAVGG